MFHRLALLLAVNGLAGILMGCGYTLVGAHKPPTGKRIALAVPPILNQSREPGLESRMTAALRQAILHRAGFALAASEGQASHRLQGVVRQFRFVAISFDARDTVVQYRIETDTRIRLVEDGAPAPLLEQDITAWAEYLVSPTGAVRENVVARNAAIVRLAQQFAEKCAALLEVSIL